MPSLHLPCLLFLSLLAVSTTAPARDLYVDPATGDDTRDGMAGPVKTIARGIRLAGAGDTVHLAPGTYFESADLSGKHGEPGQPITLDGHGAVLEGSDPVRGSDWEALGGGLFRKVKLMPRMDPAILGRWFFLWNGKMNHMGRTAKGPSAPLKKSAELQPGEWTYVQDEDAFYLRLPPDQSLDAANLRYPVRSSGVVLSREGSHLVVRKITATHVYNDGYNIHGAQRATVFENIAAIECGDDGFSAHEDAVCRIDGFVSIGNSTGLCDTVSSVTHYKNVFIKDCLGFDVFFIGDSPHSMENVLIESRAARTLVIEQHTDRPQNDLSRVSLKNVLIRRVSGPGEIRIGKNAQLTAGRCTFIGLNVTAVTGSETAFEGCVFTGEPKPDVLVWKDAKWGGAANRYDVRSFRVDQTSFTSKTFAEFPSESGSLWGPIEGTPDVGADAASLKSLAR